MSLNSSTNVPQIISFYHSLERICLLQLFQTLWEKKNTNSAIFLGVTAVGTFHVGFTISNWTCLEMFLGIIAACLPIFKPTLQRFLTSLGLEFGFNGPFSFFRSIHGTGAPAEPPQELIDETNKHSENTLKNHHTLYSLDRENLSKQTTHVGLEAVESGSYKGKEVSNGSQQSKDIV